MGRRGRLAVWMGLAGVLLGSPAGAQSLMPGPPGPFVVDVRGATSGIPSSLGLYPDRTETFVVPARGFGFDVGAHVYPFSLGAARVGIGANIIRARGTATNAEATVELIAPQISFNFGTSNGWSYLSAGVGTARVEADIPATVQALNGGGGARWFLNRHLAVGFDIRFYKLSDNDIMPASNILSAAVGFSFK
jgi:hypothetical protein